MRIFIVNLILLLTNVLDQTLAAVTTPSYKPMNTAELFLVRFGYVNVPDLGNKTMFGRSMTLDPKEVSDGIKLFQKRYKLNVTGTLNDETRKKLQAPRCGVKDIHTRSTFGRWRKRELKYKFVGSVTRYLKRSEVSEAMKNAFNYWAEVTPLTFTEVFDEEKADFILRFGRYEHGDDYPFDGKDGTLAHAFFPEDGRIHFDSDEYFTEDMQTGYNLRIVAAHEIGHALGLPHSYDNDALMAAIYGGYVPKDEILLKDDDIKNIQRIYGKNVKTVSPLLPKTSATKRFTKLLTKRPETTTTTEIPTTTTEEPVITTTTTEEPVITTTTTEEPLITTITTEEPVIATTTTETTTTSVEQQFTSTTEEPFIATEDPFPVTEPQWEKVTPGPSQPDICHSSTKLSSAFMGKDGHFYLVIEHKNIQWIYQNVITNSFIGDGWPHKLDDYFKHKNRQITAIVYSNLSKKYYLFHGTKLSVFNEFGYFDREDDIGKEIIHAFNMPKDKTIAVTKDNSAWSFNPITQEFTAPKPISSLFKEIPTDIDGAAEDYPWNDDITYIFFFKGREYYKYHASKGDLISKGQIGKSFFGCNQYPVPK